VTAKEIFLTMPREIIFYTKPDGTRPVEDFLTSLQPEHLAKAMRVIDLLEQFGAALQRPHVAVVRFKKYAGLWELRIQSAGNASRILYFSVHKDIFVLLHGFIKKTDTLPVKELEIARKRKENYLERC
jgi:phage-related protein